MSISTSSSTTKSANSQSHKEAHKHTIPVGVIEDVKSIGCANDAGTNQSLSRSDHVHQGLMTMQTDPLFPEHAAVTMTSTDNIMIRDSTVTNCLPIITIGQNTVYGYITSVTTQTIPANGFVTFDRQYYYDRINFSTSGLTPTITGMYMYNYQVRGSVTTDSTTNPTPIVFELWDTNLGSHVLGTKYASQINQQTTYTDFPSNRSVTMSINATGIIKLTADDLIQLHNVTVNSDSSNTLVSVDLQASVSPIGSPNNTKPVEINAAIFLAYLGPILAGGSQPRPNNEAA